MKFPDHLSLSLDHNGHKNVYETVAARLSQQPDYYGADNWVSVEELDLALATDEMWSLQWYPHTPVGFCVLHAHSLDKLLEASLL